ncbi:MAG: iron ABC transporter permease [Lachnospiraceae bacterium]|nr:iron ABC transporter permease [Lachnospiraceae bacterium]
MKKSGFKIGMTVLAGMFALAVSIAVGSVTIPIKEQVLILGHKLFGAAKPESVEASLISIMWSIRMPRAFLAFLAGGALSASGAVIQSVLQNPLASSYTLGVSSGASLGAAIVTVTELSIPFLGVFLLPVFGFAGGLLTVLFVIAFSARIDGNVKNHTIVLFGMVMSLFVNAVLTMLSVLASEHEHQLLAWQMGTFAGKRWYHVGILAAACLMGLVLLLRDHRELDILSFGDEQALAIGVDAPRVKKRLIVIAAFLTGVSVCFTGTIGFIDLIAPHMVRRIFGSVHRLVLPMSFLAGGICMCLADLLARTILAPQDLPVGAVTALFGAPFFMWLYFGKKGN